MKQVLVASVLALWCVTGALSAAVLEDLTSLNVHRDPKLFLKILSIKPYECATTSTTNPIGRCYTSTDCTSLGGTALGNCAFGLGVCCYITATCGSTINTNGTSFVNEDNPATTSTAQTCTTTVNIANQNICQIRLDMNTFEIDQPDITGACSVDSMTVSGTTNDDIIPTICGLNTGQHMYLNVDPDGANPTISITTTGTTFGREWDIAVTKIACDSEYQAPDGCLQYYRTTTGIVQSFNYEETTVANIANGGDVNLHLADQNYAVCIDSLTDYCSITWTTSPTTSLVAFNLAGDANANSVVLGDVTQGILDALTAPCTDYVTIASGVSDLGAASDRYCGLAFPDSVTSTAIPFNLLVTTDDVEATSATADSFNTGFSLAYTLNACK